MQPRSDSQRESAWLVPTRATCKVGQVFQASGFVLFPVVGCSGRPPESPILVKELGDAFNVACLFSTQFVLHRSQHRINTALSCQSITAPKPGCAESESISLDSFEASVTSGTLIGSPSSWEVYGTRGASKAQHAQSEGQPRGPSSRLVLGGSRMRRNEVTSRINILKVFFEALGTSYNRP